MENTLILMIMGILVLWCLSKPKYHSNREYAKCESWIERRLFNRLTKEGFQPKAQVWCGNYRIDLVLKPYRIAIECDGRAYHSTSEQKKHDQRKSGYLRRRGYSVLRFTGSDINGDIEKVIRRIQRKIG